MQNGKRVYIHTWGCQMNEHKAEGIAGTLVAEGYKLVESPQEADVIIFNTCTVRAKAVEKVFGKIGEIKRLRQKKRIILGLGGCLAQAEGASIFAKTDQVDFLFGTSNADIKRIPALIDRAKLNGRLVGIGKPDGWENIPLFRKSPFQAYVTITEGCNNLCSFCIVPYTRGPLRSRPLEDIVQEVKRLAQAGYKEVTLLGQNVDSYGKDLLKRKSFSELLSELSRTSIPRIRFTSSHPQDITTEVLEVIASSPNICEHIHMAAQSGSNKILKDMRRGYTKEEFLAKVQEARQRIPQVNITTDIIVGYPKETEQDFQETVDLMRKARFGSSFIFKYSPRPGTISAIKYEDRIPEEEKQRRLQILLSLQKQITAEENRKRLGEIVEVLVEGRSKDRKLMLGKSRDNKTVVFSGDEGMIGEFLQVKIIRATAGSLFGEIV